ncbi:SLC13 family permease [Nocardioides iriomotensis]|uniref:Arsenic transporter n=1 Tax=Nocardioides iriomotensis TaxID=715784 RepID=A0A4Q5J6K7_9ACTN|nr:SLC13 family permease [Nocardioides iriomotensis]RYU14194.1 arsenic transporter [Nocardioides iriomotensis]
MPAPLVETAAVVALVAMLAVAFAHPPEWVEATVGASAAAVLLALGAVDLDVARAQVLELLPVVGFLMAILVVASLCAAEGVFAAVGSLVAARARGRPVRTLTITFVTAAAVTAALSLDATVVLLTPVVVAAAGSALVEARPSTYACVRLANSASLLLPVSNLTNLLALPYLDLDFHAFAVLMAPVWLVVLAVEYVGHRLFFRRELAVPPHPSSTVEPRPLPAVPVAYVAAMLVGFGVASPLGIEPFWVAAATALLLAVHALRRRQVRVREVLHATHASFAVFVLGLGVVVAALADGGLADVVRRALPHDATLPSLLLVALVATVLANVVNNLPATLLLVPLVAPLGTVAVLAALVGLNVGSGLTYPGSLANLLWRRSLVRHGGPGSPRPSARTFHALSFAVTPPALVLGVVVLWAWGGAWSGLVS